MKSAQSTTDTVSGLSASSTATTKNVETATATSTASVAEVTTTTGDDDDDVAAVNSGGSSSSCGRKDEDVDGDEDEKGRDRTDLPHEEDEVRQVSEASEATEASIATTEATTAAEKAVSMVSSPSDFNRIRSRPSLWKPSLKNSFSEASSNATRHSYILSALVSLESFYVVAVFIFSLLLLVLFPPCLSSLILLPLHMVLLMMVRSWASPSQPSVLISAYLVGCCIRLGAAIAAAGTRLWMNE